MNGPPSQRRLRPRLTATLGGLTAILVLAGPGRGQTIAPAATDPPPSATPAAVDEADPEGQARPPLLREGSHLVRVIGRLYQEPLTGAWQFVIDPADEQSPGHELTMMPGTLLGEMERMIESAPGFQLVFEMTGQVFIFRARNYLMPTHPPLLIGHEERPEEAAAPPPSESGPEAATGESTEDIIRNLERSVGPVARRPDAEAEAPPPSAEATQAAGGVPQTDLVREGTVLLARRGTIRRTGDGAFLFVFDADAEGLADPPMTLLPCLLLERMDRYARQAPDNAAVLLSGHVYTYRQQNYLLPTVYRIPRERTILTP